MSAVLVLKLLLKHNPKRQCPNQASRMIRRAVPVQRAAMALLKPPIQAVPQTAENMLQAQRQQMRSSWTCQMKISGGFVHMATQNGRTDTRRTITFAARHASLRASDLPRLMRPSACPVVWLMHIYTNQTRCS